MGTPSSFANGENDAPMESTGDDIADGAVNKKVVCAALGKAVEELNVLPDTQCDENMAQML